MTNRPANPFDDLRALLDLDRTVRDLGSTESPALRVIHWPTPAVENHEHVRLGVLAGSFNPLHNGHVTLLERALASDVDIACYALCQRTVDKEKVTGIGLVDRLNLLRLDGASCSGVGTLFLNRGLYVDQAEIIRAAFPKLASLDFLVGFDKIVQIFDPRYYADRDAALARLFALAGFLVAPRFDRDVEDLIELLDEPANRRFASKVRPIEMPPELADVSSTGIRGVASGESRSAKCGVDGSDASSPEIPPLVQRFIAATGAYSLPVTLPSGEQMDRYALRLALLDVLAHCPEWAVQSADFGRLLQLATSPDQTGAAFRAFLAQSPPDPLPALREFARKAVARPRLE
jgi:nicotinamide-nucleotide adenylyltransferase